MTVWDSRASPAARLREDSGSAVLICANVVKETASVTLELQQKWFGTGLLQFPHLLHKPDHAQIKRMAKPGYEQTWNLPSAYRRSRRSAWRGRGDSAALAPRGPLPARGLNVRRPSPPRLRDGPRGFRQGRDAGGQDCLLCPRLLPWPERPASDASHPT